MTRSSNEAISCDRLKSISLWWSLILHWGSTHVTTLRTAHLVTSWTIWWNFMWNLVYSEINFLRIFLWELYYTWAVCVMISKLYASYDIQSIHSNCWIWQPKENIFLLNILKTTVMKPKLTSITKYSIMFNAILELYRKREISWSWFGISDEKWPIGQTKKT